MALAPGTRIDKTTGIITPPAPPTPEPINRSIADPQSDPAQAFLDNSFKQPQSAGVIAEQRRQESQGLIDSINNDYDARITDAKKAGAERVGQTDAISVLAGLMGSSEATNSRQKTTAANQKEVDAINNEKATKLAGVYSQITKDAHDEARQQLADATKSAEDVVARRKDSQTNAVTNLKAIAASGLVDYDKFKTSPQNQKVYQYALDSVNGSEPTLQAIFAANRPQDQLVGTPTRVGDHFIQAYHNPITGKVSYDKIEVPGGLPAEYNNFQTIGSDATGRQIIAIPDNWDGDVSKLKTVASTAPVQDDSVQPGDNPQLYSGLTSKTATAVRQRVTNFKSEPAVQNFATVQDGYNFASSLADDTTNPADDQALVYALAKALDPGSVVREGEYATAQKYSQSWINAYGKGVTQAIDGTGFLSQQARTNIKKTITTRYQASKKSYDQVSKQYEGGINNLTGRADGSKFLTDYVTAPDTSDGGDSGGDDYQSYLKAIGQ